MGALAAEGAKQRPADRLDSDYVLRMIRFGNQIRLAPNDRKRLRVLCGGREPGVIKTVAEYNAFIDVQLATLPDTTAEWRLAKWLLRQLRADDEGLPASAGFASSDRAA